VGHPRSFKKPRDETVIVRLVCHKWSVQTKGAGFAARMAWKPEVAFEKWESLAAVSDPY
jgi:hypothetical protein